MYHNLVVSLMLISCVQLRSTKQLLGRAGERFLLLGMLTHSKEGKVCIEDADGSVELDFSKLVSLYSVLKTAAPKG